MSKLVKRPHRSCLEQCNVCDRIGRVDFERLEKRLIGSDTYVAVQRVCSDCWIDFQVRLREWQEELTITLEGGAVESVEELYG